MPSSSPADRRRSWSPPDRTPRLATLVLWQVGILLVFSSWAFGGQAPWARQGILALGSVGIGLFVAVSFALVPEPGQRHPALGLLWPLWLFDVLVIASCFNPGFIEVGAPGQESLVMRQPVAWLPSAAVPRLAARELWQFNGLVLSAVNVLLVVRRRRLLRRLLFLVAANAVVLAILGTFQKLSGATGLWFGLVPSPNEHFFASFIYHNHWGAFALLSVAACLALLFHYERRRLDRDLLHSPVLLGGVATLLLALSIPLSTSRSCSVLAAAFLAAALVNLASRLALRRRQHGERAAPVLLAVLLVALLAGAAIAWLGRGVIAERSRLTSQQLSVLAQEKTLTSRLVLYRDTWRMAAARPAFGWGLESYARVFRLFNSQRASEAWIWRPFYAEAHNDWLQSLAETGFVGTGLLLAMAARLLATVRWRRVQSTVPRYLGGGLALVLGYAWLEFPFANPAVLALFAVLAAVTVRYAQLDPALNDHG